ncbi:MAG: diphosphate--fructose-6-phosphate 1-phosphotransferase [Chloroflexi bacterium]|nr:diphosphate--fructose-6-phosphate 1-phosphotransferase [Chloroflexota bacterium]
MNDRGHLVVGQSGGVTAVMNASLLGVVQEAFRHQAIDGIYGMVNGIEGLLEERLVDLRQEDPIVLEGLLQTPSAALGSCRYRLRPGDEDRALAVLKRHGVRHFLYIGGNDSAETSHRLHLAATRTGYPLQVVGIPKTVDNDLPVTDHSPGYGSAARFLATAVQDAGRDTEATARVYPVKLIEVMGRNAGWLVAASALGKRHLADPPHLIYPPERPLGLSRFVEQVQDVVRALGHAVVVVGENVCDEAGAAIAGGEVLFVDAFGHPYHESPAAFLCRTITRELGLPARFDKPGTLQRMSTLALSHVDVGEAYLAGQAAVRAAVAGESDRMVILVREPGPEYRATTGLAPLVAIAGQERRLPPDYLTEEGTAVTTAFADYARPLLGAPLPTHVHLKRVPVARVMSDG